MVKSEAQRETIKTIRQKGKNPNIRRLHQEPARSSFWKGKTFEELVAEQGVTPISSVEQLKGYWPEGADFDSFYEAAVGSRKHAKPH
jgi:hypothetical protein